jgi:hypothetical protein
MHWSQQFSLTWNQVDLKRRIIRLTETKMGLHGTSRSTGIALDVLPKQQAMGSSPTGGPGVSRGTTAGFGLSPAIEDAGNSGHTWRCNRRTFCSWQWPESQTRNRLKKPSGRISQDGF